ncbi:glycosyl transferase group 1 [Caldithrix abyssi DSM 13497]|uniref:Glycosyl transferase group 1 n=1 Tax=Caldithrix abyssi DSM 13497 TaxID=880073 RepID=H1XXD9_CALAY|nr:glycosyltransferase family 4 protein [Caldithrix abyssi]APF17857.1 Glycosyltransferase involved in cell wall bisynthesis [Caldithrix abyssi DSM 13497]EHO41924.1 glycosyl transferase group 1 [Caldithrix abyssi DSM 13497]
MRILYHHRTLGDGAEGIHIQSIVNGLIQLGHQVKVVSLVGEKTQFRKAQDARESKWDWVRKHIPQPVYELAEIGYNLKGRRMLQKAIDSFRPDIIYDRYAHFSFAALWAAKKNNLPLILEVNSPYSIQKRQWEKLYFPWLSQYGEKKIFNAAPHIIVVSTPLKKIVMDYGVPEEKITVLPNGTDPERFNPDIDDQPLRKKLKLTGKIVLGFVGILRRWHNIDQLITVLEELNLPRLNAAMIFLGDGPSYQELVEFNRAKGHEAWIRFLGRIPHSEIQQYIAMMDVAISPHATPYSSPMKILEYMAMEKAILAPDMENIRDILRDGENALLFKPDDARSLKEKLLLLIQNEDLRRRLGKTARQDVVQKFTWLGNARKTAEIAQKLVDAHRL